MIYVMECGPVQHRQQREVWVVFALDTATRHVTTRVATRRDDARGVVAEELGRAPAACCPALGSFGRRCGWTVEPAPAEVLALAGVLLVGLENQETLGPLAFTPLVDAWLRASAGFLEAMPWRQFSPSTPLAVTFGADPTSTRVLSIGGARRLPPSLAMLPDHAAFERANLDDAIILRLADTPGAVREAMALGFGQPFHPRVLRLRRGHVGHVTEDELHQLTGALAAVASLATGRAVGRAVVDGLEAIVVPCGAQESQRS